MIVTGNKVVCIACSKQNSPPYCLEGVVYNVVGTYTYMNDHCLDLLEFPNAHPPYACFPSKYFRRVTDISLFKKLLKPTKELV